MQKIGIIKQLKGKCPNCENKFIVTADDFFMTKNDVYGNLIPMIKCPWCKIYLYKYVSFGFLFGKSVIWGEPDWKFKAVKEGSIQHELEVVKEKH